MLRSVRDRDLVCTQTALGRKHGLFHILRMAAQPGAHRYGRLHITALKNFLVSSFFAPQRHTGTSSVLWNTNGISAQCHGSAFFPSEVLIKDR